MVAMSLLCLKEDAEVSGCIGIQTEDRGAQVLKMSN